MPRLQPAWLGNIPGEGYAEGKDHGRGHLSECSGVFYPKNSKGADKLRRMHGEEAMTRFSGMVYNEEEEHLLTFDATITDAQIGGVKIPSTSRRRATRSIRLGEQGPRDAAPGLRVDG